MTAPALDPIDRLRGLGERLESLDRTGARLEQSLAGAVTDPRELVDVTFDDAGLPTTLRLARHARDDATPEQLESALSRVVVAGLTAHRSVVARPEQVDAALATLATEGALEPDVVHSPDGRVGLELLLGRPVRVRLRPGCITYCAEADIAQALRAVCRAALPPQAPEGEH